ncbi:hypothetical protein [Natranaerofaba carboxydovora]|uniref:hypothetical protein n=1 Tax=Natranaerofaba carboxydovora TaxID=2742683 RepID=UPI001F13BE4D|nr:hypothetical protein [Natranaerofaba carboxydovora]
MDETRLIIGIVPSLIGFLPVYFTAIYFSNKFDESIKAGLFSALIWGGISLFGFFERTEFLSPFYHIRASNYFAGEGFPFLSLFLLAVVSLLIFYVGYKSFERREF